MKAGQDFFPQSSFLSLSKDLRIITSKLCTNQRLLKMLYYPNTDCLKGPDLTGEQIIGMVHKQIKVVPFLHIPEGCPNTLLISFNNFTPNDTNPEFRDNLITFSIYNHSDGWNLGDFTLRPYAIAGEIDAMFNEKKLTGIGTLKFMGGGNSILDGEIVGLELVYGTIHGVEDKINPIAPLG